MKCKTTTAKAHDVVTLRATFCVKCHTTLNLCQILVSRATTFRIRQNGRDLSIASDVINTVSHDRFLHLRRQGDTLTHPLDH